MVFPEPEPAAPNLLSTSLTSVCSNDLAPSKAGAEILITSNAALSNSIPKETAAGVERLLKVNQPGLIPYKSLFLTDQSQ